MRILIVGFGSIGRRHLTNVRLLLPTSAVAIWRRPDSSEPDGRGSLDSTIVVHTLPDALKFQPDAAIICVPTSLHVERAQALAEAGIHLLIEKPLSHSLQGVDQLLRCCNDRGVVLMVGYTLRFYEPLRFMKKMIDSGAIGRVLGLRAEVGQHLSEWRGNIDYSTSTSARGSLGGGVVLELSHEIDYARWLVGEVEAVYATTGRLLGLDVEDTADMLLSFKTGISGNIHLNMVQRPASRTCRVFGTEGMTCCDLLGNTVKLATKDAPTPSTVYQDKELDRNISYVAEFEHFIGAVKRIHLPIVSGEDARRVLEIALAAKDSARTGCRVTV